MIFNLSSSYAGPGIFLGLFLVPLAACDFCSLWCLNFFCQRKLEYLVPSFGQRWCSWKPWAHSFCSALLRVAPQPLPLPLHRLSTLQILLHTCTSSNSLNWLDEKRVGNHLYWKCKCHCDYVASACVGRHSTEVCVLGNWKVTTRSFLTQ